MFSLLHARGLFCGRLNSRDPVSNNLMYRIFFFEIQTFVFQLNIVVLSKFRFIGTHLYRIPLGIFTHLICRDFGYLYVDFEACYIYKMPLSVTNPDSGCKPCRRLGLEGKRNRCRGL